MKKEMEILEDIKELWESEERKVEKKKPVSSVRCEETIHQQERTRSNVLLNGWCGWWLRMENEAEWTRRMDRLIRRDGKKQTFSDRVHPNILLTGWKAWWSEMEAESKREEHSRLMEDDWAKSRGYQNNMRKEAFVRKFFTASSSRRGG
jgi:hypothetical protein